MSKEASVQVTQKAGAFETALDDVQWGETFTDTLIAARQGLQTERRMQGRRCFIKGQHNKALIGLQWKLRPLGENRTGTVYFAEVVEPVGYFFGINHLLPHIGLSQIGSVAEAQLKLIDAAVVCEPDSLFLAHEMLAVAQDITLPAAYRNYLAKRVCSMYEGQLPIDHSNMLALFKVLAYTASDRERTTAWSDVLYIQELALDSPLAIASAHGNYAASLRKAGRTMEALKFYRRALDLHEDDYLTSELADCLAELGQFQEAFKVISTFRDRCLKEINAPRHTTAGAFLREGGASRK